MSLKSLQEKIGTTPDGVFGPGTMKKAMEYYKLTPVRAAHFFAQTAHETGGFKLFSENLNYSMPAPVLMHRNGSYPQATTADLWISSHLFAPQRYLQ